MGAERPEELSEGCPSETRPAAVVGTPFTSQAPAQEGLGAAVALAVVRVWGNLSSWD